MFIKQLYDEDFVNYKKPSMFVGFPFCSFKCESDCGEHCCQNSALAQSDGVYISVDDLVKRYINNPITKSIVCGGLEPFDTWNSLYLFICKIRELTNDDIVIYTGYYENEIQDNISMLQEFDNIIIKFGRFVPNQKKHYDNILGVYLTSDNQYARRIS